MSRDTTGATPVLCPLTGFTHSGAMHGGGCRECDEQHEYLMKKHLGVDVRATAGDQTASVESLLVMLRAAGEPEQIEAYWACGAVEMKKVLPNGYVVRISVTEPAQSKARKVAKKLHDTFMKNGQMRGSR